MDFYREHDCDAIVVRRRRLVDGCREGHRGVDRQPEQPLRSLAGYF